MVRTRLFGREYIVVQVKTLWKKYAVGNLWHRPNCDIVRNGMATQENYIFRFQFPILVYLLRPISVSDFGKPISDSNFVFI